MPGVTVDWDAVKAVVGGALKDQIATVVGGAAEDLKAYGAAIAADAIRCAQDPTPERERELRAQVKLLGEMNRITANDAGWDFVAQAAKVLGQVAVAVLRSAVRL